MERKIILLITILSIFILSGCTSIESEEEIKELQTEYGFEKAFSSNLSEMSDYITELSLLKKDSTQANSKIDLEIYSAQSFYYLTKAFSSMSEINYSNNYCKSESLLNAKKYLVLSLENSEKALSLSQTNSFPRDNGLELVKNFNLSAKELKVNLEDIC
jgi:hypothetical protein